MQTFFEIYMTVVCVFLFAMWKTSGSFNMFIRIVLLVGLITGVILNYQHFA